MVRLWFLTQWREIASGERKRIIRLMATVVFRQRDGQLSEPADAIVDTGGTFCVLPPQLWKQLAVTIHEKDVWIQGVHRGHRCRVAASLGTVHLRVVDWTGNETAELEVLAYLVKRAHVPLILGFADLLERYQVGFDYRTQQAFMDEKMLRL